VPLVPSAEPELGARSTRRRWWIALAIALALIGVIAWLSIRPHGAAAPPGPIDLATEPAIGSGVMRSTAVEYDIAAPPAVPSIRPTVRRGSATPAVPPPATHDPTASELAQLYAAVGRELSALEAKKGANAAIDLWPRYRWIRINDALATQDLRTRTYEILQRLRKDIAAQ